MARGPRELIERGAKRLVARIASIPGLSPLLRSGATRGLVPRAVWCRVPVTGTFPVQAGGARFLCQGALESRVSRLLCWTGLRHCEPETMPTFIVLSRAARRFVDVGANQGVFTLVAGAVNPNLGIVAFEPLPEVFDLLSRNVALNGWQGRVRLVAGAAGARRETAQLFVPRPYFPANSSLGGTPDGRPPHSVLDVEVVPLDEADLHGVDLLKIDVEGHETEVLRGAQRLLERDHPFLVLEYLPSADGDALGKFLAPFGYELHHLTPSGPLARETLVADEERRARNYLCVPPSADRPIDRAWRKAADGLSPT